MWLPLGGRLRTGVQFAMLYLSFCFFMVIHKSPVNRYPATVGAREESQFNCNENVKWTRKKTFVVLSQCDCRIVHYCNIIDWNGSYGNLLEKSSKYLALAYWLVSRQQVSYNQRLERLLALLCSSKTCKCLPCNNMKDESCTWSNCYSRGNGWKTEF